MTWGLTNGRYFIASVTDGPVCTIAEAPASK